MIPTRLAAATTPCIAGESSGCAASCIIGITIPTIVANPAPVTCPNDATISTRRCPQRNGMVSMSTGLPSLLRPIASSLRRQRFHLSMIHSNATPTPTPTVASKNRSAQFTAGSTSGDIFDTNRMMSIVMVAMLPLPYMLSTMQNISNTKTANSIPTTEKGSTSK